MFSNPILERLSRTHPIFPALLWVPMSIYLLVAGIRDGQVSVPAQAGLWVLGLFLWTLAEYVLHRWIFHFMPTGEAWKKRWYPVHQQHHDVEEWDRLVAPPLMSIPLFFVFLGLFYAWPGTPYMLPLFSGFIVGYLAYDYIHYYTHFARPKNAIGKALRRRHMMHHHAHHDKWYGISSPLWDYIFRTHVPEAKRERASAT